MFVGTLAVFALGRYLAWNRLAAPALPACIAEGNGRIEATDTAALSAGRIANMAVSAGDNIRPGDVLVLMDTDQLRAQKSHAKAQLRRSWQILLP